jgi:hypothetical protein
MTRDRWPLAVSILFLAVAVSSCASQGNTGTAASTDFGGQPKDQEARERHHPQYPDSAQHLGPQQDQPATSNDAAKSREQIEAERAAVSGVGK